MVSICLSSRRRQTRCALVTRVQTCALPIANSGTDPNWQVKEDLAAAYRMVHQLGLDDSIYTHISARLPGGHDRCLSNPYGMRFEEVKASNLVTVDIDGAVIDDPLGQIGRAHV